MLVQEYGFKPADAEKSSSDFLVEDAFFFFVFVDASSPLVDKTALKNEFRIFLESLRDTLKTLSSLTLLQFKEAVEEGMTKIKQDSVSFAGGVAAGDVVYLVTKGKGTIYLKRNDALKRIIKGDKSASGKSEEGDFFVCGVDIHVFGEEQLKKSMSDRSPQECAKNCEALMSALFIRASLPEKLVHFEKEQKAKFPLTAVVVVLLFIILLWSVVFGVRRRADAALKKQVVVYTQDIKQVLNEAQGAASQDANKALSLINTAKEKRDELKKILAKRKIQTIDDLTQKIEQAEKNITKKEEKTYEEFYDLHLIEKGAYGSTLSVYHDILSILNPGDGKAYLLSLAKKSVETIAGDELKEANHIVLYNNELFAYTKNKGVLKFDTERKSNIVIAKDDDWGEIRDFTLYNGNLYLLDGAKDEIYKYIAAGNGYSSKTSYFKKGQGIDLADAHSIAIDSSVYIGGLHGVYKYTAGGRDGFSIQLPGSARPKFGKVFTDKTLHHVYDLDKEQGALFIFSKDGAFEAQIDSTIFTKADDFIVREDNGDSPDVPAGIFVLAKNKLYKVLLK